MATTMATTMNVDSIGSRPSNLSSIFDALIPSLFSFSKRTPRPAPRAPPPPTNEQSPFAFFTSGYMLGLLLLAIVLHRIKHTVVPNPIHTTRIHNNNDPRAGRRGALRFLPLDLTHTPTRLALHLPTLYLLAKALALWALIVLTAFPVPVAPPLVAWLARHETHEVCWLTFCAICAAFCVEAFIKALDGRGMHGPLMGMGASESMNTSPFNLVGYAILLHSYASPTKQLPSASTPSRPDKHAAIIIAIPLLQLTLLHLLSVSKRHSTHRLLPTALASLLSLTHFHTTLLSYLLAPKPSTPPAPTPTLPSLPTASPSPRPGTPHTSLPTLNYIPNIFETLLLLSIALSAALDRLARLLIHTDAAAFPTRPRRRQHSYTSPSSPPSSSSTVQADTPGLLARLPYDEDFGVVLLHAGLRSLEGGGTRGRGGGWRNEVGGIYLGVREPTGLDVRHEPANTTANTTAGAGARRCPRGLANELRMAHAHVPTYAQALAGGGVVGWAEETFGARRVGVRLWMCVRFLWAVGRGVGRGLRGVWGLLWGGKGGDDEGGGREEQEEEQDEEQEDEEEEEEMVDEREWNEEVLYQRFLTGDVSDDEEDGDYSAGPGLDDETEDEDAEAEAGDEQGWNGQKEALRLLGELIFGAGASGHEDGDATVREAGQLVLAQLAGHAQGAGPGPGALTRRRWRGGASDGHGVRLGPALGVGPRLGVGPDLGRGEAEEERRVDRWIDERRGVGRERGRVREEEKERERDWCVVCMSEGREVICWPCRCLAMCNACREALAAQSAASAHRCPCCRRGVDGFSRIYVP